MNGRPIAQGVPAVPQRRQRGRPRTALWGRKSALGVKELRLHVTRRADGTLEVSSPAYCHAVHVEDRGREVISDNWFDLLPGVPVRVRLAADHRELDRQHRQKSKPI